MEKNMILKKVNSIFIEVFDDDTLEINETTSAKDIEDWDSLTHITLVNSIEEAFGMTFSLDEVLNMKDVGEMLEIISSRSVGD